MIIIWSGWNAENFYSYWNLIFSCSLIPESAPRIPKEPDSASEAGSEQTELASASWLADMATATATGGSTRSGASIVSLLLLVVGFIFTIFG